VEKPLVSVVIPTYNRAHLLSRAIRSALAQDFPELEVIVVDDGSTDETPQSVSQFEAVRVITFEHNRGGAATRNAGIEAARGEFVAFLDSDDEWLPTKTRRQVDVMRGSSAIGAVYCRYFVQDDATGQRIEGFSELYTGSIRPVLFRGRCPRSVSLFLVRRAALEQVGGFDESLAGFQDADLWIRLSDKWEFGAVDEALVVIHEHSGIRVTTDPIVRERALDSFLDKWQEPMTEAMGTSGIAAYRRRNMAVARAAQVLSLVEFGHRGRAAKELIRYFQVAGWRNRAQAVGLVLACLLGKRFHSRLRAALHSARNKR
jgi:glycosyltransferase involved in cell wall biosynthesis